MTEKIHYTLTIPEIAGGQRLDQVLVKLLPEFSRTQIQGWIKKGEITLNGHQPKPRENVRGGEEVIIEAAPRPQLTWEARPIALSIMYEDEVLLILNKPVGMVVHPGTGNWDNTLVNALLHHLPNLQTLPRAGIIHRLDKDTSGLLVVAKTPEVLKELSHQLKARKIIRIYQAIVCGVLTSGGTITQPIGRHPIQRMRMAVIETGKTAITHYRVMERYNAHTRIKIQLETGRTHQIRVHTAYIHYPILGDPIYGKRLQLPKNASPELIAALRQFKRQALHASELTLVHPITQKSMTWQAPLPEDMQRLIEILKQPYGSRRKGTPERA